MKQHLLLLIALLSTSIHIYGQIEEDFSPAPVGWILAQGAGFTVVNGNDAVVTSGVGGNNPAVIGTPAVNKTSNTIKVCINVTPYTSNLNSKTSFPCNTFMDVLFVKSTVATANDAQVAANIYARVDNYQLPSTGGSSCFTFHFPAGISATDFKVVLSFHAACTQSGIKYVLDDLSISGVDDVCSGATCPPVALDDVIDRTDVNELSFSAILYGSNINYPAPGVNMAVDLTGTDNDQNDNYSHLKWAVVTPPANGTASINADGTCTITRNNLKVKQLVFVYRLCDDGPDDNFLTTGDNLCDDATVTINFAVSSSLPVHLIQFTATRVDGEIMVSWITATESNNKGFEIQRCLGGSAFQTLAFIPSKATVGYSDSPLKYDYKDNDPSSATAYYRLIQWDKDGRKTVYVTKGVSAQNASSATISFSRNPAYREPVTVYLNGATNADIIIMDSQGAIRQRWLHCKEGSLALGTLPAGIYLVHLLDKSNDHHITQKLVVLQ